MKKGPICGTLVIWGSIIVMFLNHIAWKPKIPTTTTKLEYVPVKVTECWRELGSIGERKLTLWWDWY